MPSKNLFLGLTIDENELSLSFMAGLPNSLVKKHHLPRQPIKFDNLPSFSALRNKTLPLLKTEKGMGP